MRKWLQRLAREPLVQFLFAGAVLFLVFSLVGREDEVDATRQIVVDDAALLAFLQFRSKTVSPESFQQQLEQLSPQDLRRAIDEYVRQEALYREAKTLGLDEADYGVRQRIIRQLEFVNEGIVSSTIDLSDEDLKNHLDQDPDRYRVPETITFTHVFFSVDRHGEEAAKQKAHDKLVELAGTDGGAAVPFHQATGHGDRFLYLQNYVKQEAAQVASHFGADMQREIFALEPDDRGWRGPLQSPYGFHLVLVTKRTPAYIPEFEKLRRRLTIDAYQHQLQQQLRQIEDSVIDAYHVKVDDSLKKRLQSQETPE